MKKILLLSSLIATCSISRAAIVYTDIPDATYSASGDEYNLDLDGNSVVDFKISMFYPASETHNQITLIHQGSNRGGVETVLGWLGKLAWNLNSNDNIDSGLSTWMTSGLGSPNEIFLSYYADAMNNGGGFLNQEGYLPVEFKIGPNTHYGWVRVATNANSTEFTIKDYAYEDVPDTGILAGDTGSSANINEINMINIEVYPNPAKETVQVALEESVSVESITVKSNDGRLVYALIGNNIIGQTSTLSLPEESGVYFIEIGLENNQRIVRRVIRQ